MRKQTGVVENIVDVFVYTRFWVTHYHDAIGRLECHIWTVNHFFVVFILKSGDCDFHFEEISFKNVSSEAVIRIQTLNLGEVFIIDFEIASWLLESEAFWSLGCHHEHFEIGLFLWMIDKLVIWVAWHAFFTRVENLVSISFFKNEYLVLELIHFPLVLLLSFYLHLQLFLLIFRALLLTNKIGICGLNNQRPSRRQKWSIFKIWHVINGPSWIQDFISFL